VINEIMYAPSSPEPEWIELLNRGTEPVNLKKWQVSDATATRHFLPAGDIVLAPGGFLLLTKDSALLCDARGVMSGSVIGVPGFPSLNNNGDAVVLFDAEGRMADSLVYRPEWGGGEGGRSLERRDADALSSASDNWGTCTLSAGATPGQPNSIVRCLYDLSIAAVFPPWRNSDTVLATVRNIGKLPAGGYAVLVYDDADRDSIAQPGELVGRSDPQTILPPGDSVHLPYRISLSSGSHQLILVVQFPADQRSADNQVFCMAIRPFTRGVLLVNEIMAEPDSGRSEYLELVNVSDGDVDLEGWTVTDLAGRAGEVLISASARLIHPREFLVLVMDPALFSEFPALKNVDPRLVLLPHRGRLALNNDGDVVALHDPLGVTVDSVLYSVSWHNPDLSDPAGRSLERISADVPTNDSRNWGTCVDPSGGTPGMRNSIGVGLPPAASRLSCAPNPFSPDGDGFDDVTVIHYEMPLKTSIINVKIFDIRGRLIRRLASNEPGGLAGNIIWDGRDETGGIARIGIYLVLLEAINGSGARDSARGVLVLARRL
jgi:hypothetical protein